MSEVVSVIHHVLGTGGASHFDNLLEWTGARPSILRYWLTKLGARSYLGYWTFGDVVRLACDLNGVD